MAASIGIQIQIEIGRRILRYFSKNRGVLNTKSSLKQRFFKTHNIEKKTISIKLLKIPKKKKIED
jgi:hypothetical protein